MVNPVSTLLSGMQAQAVKFANTAQNIASADVPDYAVVTTTIQSADAGGGVVARTATAVPLQGVNIDSDLISGIQASQAYKAAATALSRVSEMQNVLLNAVDKNA